MQEVIGVLPGRVEADVKVDVAQPGDDLLEALAQFGITCRGLCEGQVAGGGVVIVAQEGGIMPIA